jgi:hypothetical protein
MNKASKNSVQHVRSWYAVNEHYGSSTPVYFVESALTHYVQMCCECFGSAVLVV